jgi:hypothetical protein
MPKLPWWVTPQFNPYDDEEGRTPVALPETSMPTRPTPLPMPGTPPGGVMRGPAINRQSRYDEMQEAKDVYLQGTPGRLKSGLLGAFRGGLQGLATGQGLGGALGGAVAGAGFGAINPRGQREMQFNEQVRPKIAERWGYEAQDAAAQRQAAIDEQNALMNRGRLAEIEAGIDLKQSEAEKNRRPIASPVGLKLGTNRKTGRLEWYDARNPNTAGNFDPYTKPETQQKVFRPNERGEYVDVAAETAAGRKVKAYQRPRAAAKPKEGKKTIAITDLRAWAEENNMTTDQAGAKWRADGYTVTRDR